MMKLEYFEDRDVELWVVRGPKWFVPVYAKACLLDGKPAYSVRHEADLTTDQFYEFKGFIDRFTAAKHVRRWIILESVITDIAHRAPGITPKFYFTWESTEDKEANTKKSKAEFIAATKRQDIECEEFLDHVRRSTGVADMDVLRLVWIAICQSLPGWLLSGKALTFGFMKMFALPYRSNWKTLFLARCPWLPNTYKSSERDQILTHYGVTHRAMTYTEMAASRKRYGHMMFDWHIETVANRSWVDTVIEHELPPARALGRIGYVQRWASIVDNLQDHIHEACAAKINESVREAPRLSYDHRHRGTFFISGSPTLVGRANLSSLYADGPQSVDDYATLNGVGAYMESTNEKLRALSDVQPPPPDVWNTRTNVQ